jgi:hypothetical protein
MIPNDVPLIPSYTLRPPVMTLLTFLTLPMFHVWKIRILSKRNKGLCIMFSPTSNTLPRVRIVLSATKLCQELTLMKLDDKWRKRFESYLHFWIARIQDLEGIVDKPAGNDTKRIWLTNTLSSQPDMDTAIRQAITT